MNAILLGDSIRIGYLPHVEKALAPEFHVWGPEMNCGETTRTLAHLDEWVTQRITPQTADTTVLHLNCGLHDLKFTDQDNQPDDTPKVPLEQYKQNVQQILESALQVLPAERIIWALTTPVLDERHNTRKSFIRREADVENYNTVATAICKQLGIPIHDLHTFVMQNNPQQIMTPDGVHYTTEGYTLLGQAVADRVRQALA